MKPGADTSGPMESDALDVAGFYRHAWRRRPMVWRGCGSAFLSPALDWPEVTELEQRLGECGDGHGVRRSPDGSVLFVNQAQQVLPELARACTALAAAFDWEVCTADLSVTRHPGAGIGCHFDHSDNFVVQQQGSKRWRVGLPEDTTPRRQRARMLETKGFIPSGTLPERPLEVELLPGDVLYLPVFAPHEGVESATDRGSISVSFSYNATSALGRHLKALLRRLSEEDAWWEPLPVDGPDTARLEESLGRAFADILGDRNAPVSPHTP